METLTVNLSPLRLLGGLPPCHRQDVYRPWSEILTASELMILLTSLDLWTPGQFCG